MRGHRIVVVAVLVAGTAAGAAGQTPPGYVRDGKVWFKVVEAGSGEPFDGVTWTAPAAGADGCFRLADWAAGTGVRYGSFQKGTVGPGTFTLETCSEPATNGGTVELEQHPSARDPWAILQPTPPVL